MNSDLDPYILQYRLPKYIGRQEEQTTKVMTGGKRVKIYYEALQFLENPTVRN